MELLIIFIITMVISSILRSFRGAGGRSSTAPVPRRPQRPFPPDMFNLPEENIEEMLIGGLDFLERPGRGQKENVPEREITRQQKVVTKHVPEKTVQQFYRPQKSASPRVQNFPGKELNIGEGLRRLLNGENLPLGIVAAEIFSAPRARRPFGRK